VKGLGWLLLFLGALALLVSEDEEPRQETPDAARERGWL